MTKPTYDELLAEVKRLRSKLSFGEDEEFTKEVRLRMAPKDHQTMDKFLRAGYYVVRPSEIWEVLFPMDKHPSTRDLAKLGRSLQALGWARSARLGNVVFKIPAEEYAN